MKRDKKITVSEDAECCYSLALIEIKDGQPLAAERGKIVWDFNDYLKENTWIIVK